MGIEDALAALDGLIERLTDDREIMALMWAETALTMVTPDALTAMIRWIGDQQFKAGDNS